MSFCEFTSLLTSIVPGVCRCAWVGSGFGCLMVVNADVFWHCRLAPSGRGYIHGGKARAVLYCYPQPSIFSSLNHTRLFYAPRRIFPRVYKPSQTSIAEHQPERQQGWKQTHPHKHILAIHCPSSPTYFLAKTNPTLLYHHPRCHHHRRRRHFSQPSHQTHSYNPNASSLHPQPSRHRHHCSPYQALLPRQ